MQQIVDLQNDPEFQKLNIALISIARDSIEEQAPAVAEYKVPSGVPLLADTDTKVAADYDVMKYALANGEPSHTFVLVNKQGEISWVKDYGAPDNPDRVMYVDPAELVRLIQDANLEK